MICSNFSVLVNRFLLAMYIFRTPAKNQFRKKCRPYVNFDLKNPTWRSSHWRCSIKKMFLKISQNSQKNTPSAFCEFCENVLRMFFFIEYIRTIASECVCYFFDSKLVFLLHSSVKFGVSVMLRSEVIKNCQHLWFSYEFLNIFQRHKVYFIEKVAKILEDMLS